MLFLMPKESKAAVIQNFNYDYNVENTMAGEAFRGLKITPTKNIFLTRVYIKADTENDPFICRLFNDGGSEIVLEDQTPVINDNGFYYCKINVKLQKDHAYDIGQDGPNTIYYDDTASLPDTFTDVIVNSGYDDTNSISDYHPDFPIGVTGIAYDVLPEEIGFTQYHDEITANDKLLDYLNFNAQLQSVFACAIIFLLVSLLGITIFK